MVSETDTVLFEFQAWRANSSVSFGKERGLILQQNMVIYLQ